MYTVEQLRKLGGSNIDKFRPHDPTYVGPGLWIAIHRASLDLSPNEFIRFIQGLLHKFPCDHCRPHFQKYVDLHPMEEYRNVFLKYKEEVTNLGMFLWAWEFHNSVNQRLGKPLMSWDTACQLYIDDNHNCSKSCKLSK